MKPDNPGFVVMMNRLFGNDTGRILSSCVGHTIAGIKLENNEILLSLNDGRTIKITDEGQSCCESRYITTDADLPSYVGQKIRDFRRGEYTDQNEDDFDYHDVQSLLIDTTEGTIDFVTHVDHNGYYGGFSITAREISNN